MADAEPLVPNTETTISGTPITYANVNEEITYTASDSGTSNPPITGYTWYPNGFAWYASGYCNSSNPAVIYYQTTGTKTYSVKATNSIGSTFSIEKSVEIYGAPSSIVISGDETIAIGVESVYSLIVTGGNYDSLTYAWTITGGVENTDYTISGGKTSSTLELTPTTLLPTKLTCSVQAKDPASGDVGSAVTDCITYPTIGPSRMKKDFGILVNNTLYKVK